jgi:hypothetical protein
MGACFDRNNELMAEYRTVDGCRGADGYWREFIERPDILERLCVYKKNGITKAGPLEQCIVEKGSLMGFVTEESRNSNVSRRSSAAKGKSKKKTTDGASPSKPVR